MDLGSHYPRACDRKDYVCETTELLRSNREPSSAECTIIRALIGEISEEIELIDTESKRLHPVLADLDIRRRKIRFDAEDFKPTGIESDRLRRVLADLDMRQRKIRSDAKSLRSVLSGRRRLPVELISEIFMHCLPLRHEPSPTKIPWLLGGICQLWREVALSTPALWSFLAINTTARQKTEAYHRAVNAWFYRSGNCMISLKLSLEWDEDFKSVAEIHSHPLFRLALQHCHRWQHLHIHVGSDPSAESLSVLAGRLPSLESLQIDTGGSEAAYNAVLNQKGFGDAPKLRNLVIDSYWARLSVFQISWGLLTRLRIETWRTDHHNFHVLGQCRALLKLSINAFHDTEPVDEENDSSRKPIEFLHLQSLEFVVLRYNKRLLNNFSTPALRHLSFEQHGGDLSFPRGSERSLKKSEIQIAKSDFHSFLCRSQRGITSLKLDFDGVHITSEAADLITYLTETPQLERFVLTVKGDLAVLDVPNHLIPKLHTLKIKFNWESAGFPDNAFAKMLQKRKEIKTLRSIELKGIVPGSSTQLLSHTLGVLHHYSQEPGVMVRVVDSGGKSLV